MEKQRSIIGTISLYTGIALLLFILYVASYPVTIKIHESLQHTPTSLSGFDIYVADSDVFPLYKPVDWMLDNNHVFRSTFFYWCKIVGNREEFEFAWFWRNMANGPIQSN